MPSRTIRHPLGLKAEVDIQPRSVSDRATATQTVRISVDKTSEAVLGRCYADAANAWVTFDDEPRFNHPFDPEVGSRSLFGKRNLPLVTCRIALVTGISIPQPNPETVTVRLEARDPSARTQALFNPPDLDAVIDLMIDW